MRSVFRVWAGGAGLFFLAVWSVSGHLTTVQAEESAPNRLVSATHGSDPVTVELIAEHASIQPGGNSRVGVSFEIEPGWHIYAEDPGDAGLPTQVIWTAPTAVSFEPLVWPKAERFVDPGDIQTFGYREITVLYSRITFTPLLNPEGIYPDLPISAKVKWLACKEICLPGHAELALSLPVRTKPPLFSTHAELFELTDDSAN